MKHTFSNAVPKGKEWMAITWVAQGKDEIVTSDKGLRTVRVNAGKPGEVSRRKLVIAARKAVAMAKGAGVKKIVTRWADIAEYATTDIHPEALAELFAVNMEMANYEYVAYKTKPKDGWPFVHEIAIVGVKDAAIERAWKKGKTIGEHVNKTRDLANTPPGEMTPSLLAEEAERAVAGLPVAVTVLGVREMAELKMGAILGAGRGSSDEPKFIVMEYKGGVENEKPVVLVGKGVTFDSGGLNLKPSDAMYEMHMDMSGGAAVIQTVTLAARLKLKKNVIGLVPAVENMPSGSAYHPGDVLRSMSGKTIEILNTDAEGRVILADALHYAKRYKPALVVDVATLTGAAMIALGDYASAIFSPDEKLLERVRTLGEESGDYVWPLPLWEEYEEDIKGTFGDWANTGKGRKAGAQSGAVFLHQFAKSSATDAKAAYPWLHIDMAPRMTADAHEHLAKGAAGTPVRLLIRMLESF